MAFVFYRIYNDPSLMKSFKIMTIFYNYLSNIFGKNVTFSKICITTCFIGMALDVCAVVKRDTTLL